MSFDQDSSWDVRTPPYIQRAGVDISELRFRWEEWVTDADFNFDADKFVKALETSTLRARVVVGVGIFEWIIFRFRSVSSDPTPFQVAEAAWCATIDERYMRYDEFDRNEWSGPVRGPLWFALTLLIPLTLLDDNNSSDWDSAVLLLIKLAVHVLPSPEKFLAWLDAVIARMNFLYPAIAVSPFQDLFGENFEERRGPLIPSEVLDPDFLFTPNMTESLISQFLRSVDYRRNPYLASPEEMAEEGYVGVPYS